MNGCIASPAVASSLLSLLPCLAQWSRGRIPLGPFCQNFLLFPSHFFQTLTLSKTNQNSSFWGDFLHTCHLTCLFYDNAKKIQKCFLLIIFSSSRKRHILSTFQVLFKDVSFKLSKLESFSNFLWIYFIFQNTFKIFSKHFNKLTLFFFPWSTQFEDKTKLVFLGFLNRSWASLTV